MLQRHKFEIHGLHCSLLDVAVKGWDKEPTCWPQHPIRLQSWQIALFELVLRTTTFHDGHARQETTQIDRGKDGLISQDSSDNGSIVVLEIDLPL